ncbi:cytochrome c family protein [Ponticaulis sp.]|uniref:c-type cytochrome n=1 Tax=Ponticaulis sp. TaxID=2020902 RepID=UPI000B687D88|nr:cytochrome c family protein [Ponticaulis sp.]MAI89573.1 cytochrome c family protein [Ponticaulis sp.]OUY00600.1 MAG: hypothetical protein CBB65_03970 [Hyphomonadaceae bacterium TMED5]|tara:strand:- start:38837 stop:39376 length:540 start_codon:yes stop_codon:yes gene_type:complete
MRFTLMTAALALTLAACGGPEEPAPAPPAETAAPAPTAAPSPEMTPPAEAAPPVEEAAIESPYADAIAALPAPYNEADFEVGQSIFRQCAACHLVEEGAGHRVGPNLHGVFGREIGSLPDFNYSDPVKEADFTWTPEQLDHWLENPRAFLPGNRMSFAGVRRPSDRVNVIGYLMVVTEE